MKIRARLCAVVCAAVCVFVLVPAVFFPAASAADQTDPRLDALFAALQTASGAKDAGPVVEEIWKIWLASGDINIDREMRHGVDAMNAGQYGRAAAVFTNLIKRHPDFAEAWNKRATVYFLAGRFDASAADAVKTLDLEPRHFGALAGLGQIYAAQGEYEIAIAWFERGLRVNPHMPQVRESVRTLRSELKGRAI